MTILQKIQRLFSFSNTHRKVFKDKLLEKELLKSGYFTYPLLTVEEIKACLTVYKETDAEVSEVKYNTLEVKNYLNRKKVFEKLDDLLANKWEEIFNDYKPIGYNFAIKKANSFKKFDAHVDDIHADESLHTSVNVWIPLIDVNPSNGGLYMIKGSHKLPMPVRGIGIPFPFENELEAIEEKAQATTLKAGTAIFFHSKMVHGSPGNTTDLDRPAIIAGMIPKEAEAIAYVRHEEISHQEVELFVTPPEFYFKIEIGKRPSFAKSLGVSPYERIPYNPKTILNLLES